MKLITVLLNSIFLVSCGQNSYNESRELVLNPEGNKKGTFISSSPDTTTKDRWSFNKYLIDPQTPQLAKDIFNNRWKFKDDEPLEFLEKLHGQDKDARPFYFRVVTNSYKQADGAYSEGLGNAAYEYVKNYPGEFLNYFVGQEAFSDNDLQTWADIVMLEFEIISENEYDKPFVKNYLDTVGKNCKECSEQQKKVLEKFGRYLNQRWSEFLKHIDK
jgi:hypothetical protein